MNKTPLQNIWYSISQTWKYERAIIVIIMLQIVIGVLVPFIAIYLPAVILSGILLTAKESVTLLTLIGLMVLLAVCNCTNAYITAIYNTHILNNKIHFLTDLFRKKMELPYAFVESGAGQNQYQYALSILFNDSQGVSGMLRTLGGLFGSICSIVLYLGLIASLDVRVVALLMLTSVLHLFVLARLLAKQHAKKEQGISAERKTEYLFDYVKKEENNKDIKLFAMQPLLSKVADTLIYKRVRWIKEVASYDLFAAISDMVLLIARDGLAYFFVFQAIFNGKIQVSEFVFYFGAITGFSAFMTGLTSSAAFIAQKSREVDGLRGYLEIEDTKEVGEAFDCPMEEGICIQLVDVSFRFDKEGPYLLEHLNLTIHKGEKLALVGENGAGKTTLVKLICGFYEPAKGKILLNGTDMSKLSKKSIANVFASVFQDIYLMPMSVGENIAFEEASEKAEEIKHCIALAELSHVLCDLKAPVTKMLHQDGIVLSGGQEQKLVFARAAYKVLYQQAKVLILDEPTAALDPIAERAFYEKYHMLAENTTSLFISHRLASTRFCDRILLLEGGAITESGTHEQLIAAGGKYCELYEIQSKYYQSEKTADAIAQ